MPSRQDEQKITVAYRDRMIVELGHEIALNPKDATAYRKRGLLFGQNSHYDHAIADFDRVLALNPSDAGAYFLRGLAWHRKHDPKRAIVDYDKAIEFGPANEKFYREHREKAEHDAHVVHAPANTGAQNATSVPAKGLTGFFKRLAQYYAEFLSTDFKKQRLPRRRLENADAQGRLVGIPLRKYPGFQQKLWEELAKPCSHLSPVVG
jgi:tetratricopeptide (TPR) repeat protein